MLIQNRSSISNVEKILQVQKIHKAIINLKGFNTLTVKWFDEFDLDEKGNYYFDEIIFIGKMAIFNQQAANAYSFFINGTNIIFCKSKNGVFSKFQISMSDLVFFK